MDEQFSHGSSPADQSSESGDPVTPSSRSSYPPEAFEFVREGLEHTVHALHGPDPELVEGEDRHVNGRELSLGLRDHSIRRFGLMAHSVLSYWNIQRSDDFGRIVYALIEQGVMSRTDRDRLEDFFGVFDFNEAFSRSAVEEALIVMREESSPRG
ncbi:MAG: hypothetical protein GY895_11335 [Phycisphaera sp.]|nr:hypothetical protein [Phycisphaera sp.]